MSSRHEQDQIQEEGDRGMWIRQYVRNTEFQLMLSIIWALILWQLFIRILRSFFPGLVYRFSLSTRQEIDDSCRCHTIVCSLPVKTCLRAVFSCDVSEVKVVEIAKKLLERIAGNNPSVTFNTRSAMPSIRKRQREAPSSIRRRNLKTEFYFSVRLDLSSTLSRHENGAFGKPLHAGFVC